MFIEKTLETLAYLYRNETRIVQCSEGSYSNGKTIFRKPASEEEISRLLSIYSPLPEDYMKFLSITNGMRPFEDVDWSSENNIFSTSDLMFANEPYASSSWLIVAVICDDCILINLDDVANNKTEYMYLTVGPCDFIDARSLYCDFQTWLDRFIMAQGNKYWTWRVEDRKY